MYNSWFAGRVLLSCLILTSLSAKDSASAQHEEKASAPHKAEQSKKVSPRSQEKPTDVEQAIAKWEEVTSKLARQLDSVTSKMHNAVQEAKDSEGCTIKIGELTLTIEKGNEYYIKLFVIAVLAKEFLKQYDQNPSVATRKIIDQAKTVFVECAKAVGFMKTPAQVKPWWKF
ncbi:MAG: hypothetical protein WD449_01810 [Candidatus Babeliales bacterium]